MRFLFGTRAPMSQLDFEWYGPPLGGDSIVRFYRSFKCTHGSEERSYSLGDLCWIKSSRDAAVCLLQIHTLWQKLSNARMFAGGRLFFRPEDTPKGRHPEHGQDEVLLWNRTVVLRCSELVEWHLRAQMAPLWPSGTMATYKREWEEIPAKMRNTLTIVTEMKEKSKISDNRKSRYCFNDIGRPSLKRTPLFASGFAVSELDDMPRGKGKTPTVNELGRNSTPKPRVAKGQPGMTKGSLEDGHKKPVVGIAQQRCYNSANGRRNKHMVENETSAPLHKKGRKKVPLQGRKHVYKRSKETTEAVTTRSVTESPLSSVAQNLDCQSLSLPQKSELGSVEVSDVVVSKATDNSLNDVTTVNLSLPSVERRHSGTTMLLTSTISIKEEQGCNDHTHAKMLYTDERSEPTSMISTEETIVQPGTEDTARRTHSISGKIHGAPRRWSFNPAAPILARARKLKLQKKRRQSREQAEMAIEDEQNVNSFGHIQGSELEDDDDSEIMAKGAENGQRPQRRRRRRKQKKIFSAEVKAQRHVVRRTSMVVKRDITELFALCSNISSTLPTVVLVGYSHYCRYKALQLRLAEYERLWCHPDIESMTGMKVTDDNTRLIFCRALFKNPNLLKLGVTMAMSVPNFVREQTGRRKRRHSLDITEELGPVKKSVWSEEEAEREFMESLQQFMADQQTPMGPPPRMGFQQVNLFAFFNCTQHLGGYDEVTASKLWRDVYLHMGGTTLITSAASSAKKQYEKYLLAYERHIRSDCLNS